MGLGKGAVGGKSGGKVGRGTGGNGKWTEGSALRRRLSRAQMADEAMLPLFSLLLRQKLQPGYSSVGRASDCRFQQASDGPWFDSGCPDTPRSRMAVGAAMVGAPRICCHSRDD